MSTIYNLAIRFSDLSVLLQKRIAKSPTMKSKNFMLTKNNPKESLEEFHQILKADSVYARV